MLHSILARGPKSLQNPDLTSLPDQEIQRGCDPQLFRDGRESCAADPDFGRGVGQASVSGETAKREAVQERSKVVEITYQYFAGQDQEVKHCLIGIFSSIFHVFCYLATLNKARANVSFELVDYNLSSVRRRLAIFVRSCVGTVP